MLRKSISALFVVTVVAMALVFTGCTKRFTSNNLQSFRIAPNFEPGVTLADLEVSEKKVTGSAQGKLVFPVTESGVYQSAVEQAILQAGNADVLVGVNKFTTRKIKWLIGDSLYVTVTGYPARFKDFRAKPDSLNNIKRRAYMVLDHRVSGSGADGAAASPAVIIPVPAPVPSEE
jgi:hypothetical protein